MAYISGQIREKLASKDGRSFAVKMRVFKNVVAQFIGQMRLMNQATTEI